MLAALVLAVFVNNASFSMTTVMLPSIQRSFDLDFGALQWAVTAYVVTYAAFMLLGGRLADAIGLRRVLLAGVLLYVAAVTIVSTAPDQTIFFCGRALQGVAAALVTPTTTSAARTRFTGAAQTRAIGIVVGMSAIALALGSPLGGVLDHAVGWRTTFVVNVPLLAVSAALVAVLLPRGRVATAARRLDLGGVLLFGGSLAALTIGVSEAGGSGFTSPTVLALLGSSVALLAGFGLHVRGRNDALVDPSLFRSRTFVVSTLVGFTMTMTLTCVLFFEALYFEKARGFGTIETGLVFLPMTAVFGLLSTRAAWVERRLGRRLPTIAGLGTAAAGGLVLALDRPEAAIAQPIGGLFLIGLGLGVSWAQVTSIGLRAVPAGRAGQAAGILFTARWVGGAIGIAVLGVVYRAVADERLQSGLARLGLGLDRGDRDRLDGLLAGASSGRRVLATLPPHARPDVLDTVRNAAAGGVAWALACVTVAALLGGLLCLRFPREHGEAAADLAGPATVPARS